MAATLRTERQRARIAFMRSLTQEDRLRLIAEEIATACPEWESDGETFARLIWAKKVDVRQMADSPLGHPAPTQ
jgi:hypothetical protein